MFIEVDVSQSANCPLSVTRMFDAMDEPIQVSQVETSDLEGVEGMYAVTGWSTELGPCPAYAVLVEDSGEGIVMLVYGGDEGIRLRSTDRGEQWDLKSPNQWGEVCLLLDKDVKLTLLEDRA